MTESEMIQYHNEQINSLITMNNWSVGVLIGVIVAVFGFLGYLQLRLSDKQIEKLKSDIDKDLNDKYKLELIKVKEENDKKIAESIYKIIFIEIENILMVEIRHVWAIKKVASLIDEVSNIKKMTNKDVAILIDYFTNFIEGEKVFQRGFEQNDYIEYIYYSDKIIDFVEHKSDKEFLIKIDYENKFKEIYSKFKESHAN